MSRKILWRGVSVLALAAFSPNAHALIINSFEDNAEIKKWAFYNGGEHPGARGSFVNGTERGNAFGELRYDFTSPALLPEKFDPRYVQPLKNGTDPVGCHIQANMAGWQPFMGWWADRPIMVLYDIRDAGSDPFEPEHNFGLLRQDYSEKPGMIAVSYFFAQAKNPSLEGLVSAASLPRGVHIARLDGENDRVFMIWAEEDASECRIQIKHTTVRAFAIYGNEIERVTEGDASQLAVNPGHGPIYVNTFNQY